MARSEVAPGSRQVAGGCVAQCLGEASDCCPVAGASDRWAVAPVHSVRLSVLPHLSYMSCTPSQPHDHMCPFLRCCGEAHVDAMHWDRVLRGSPVPPKAVAARSVGAPG